MPLSEAHPRKHIHTRKVECEGYEREDGLWDIEAVLCDTKSYSYANHDRGQINAGEPVHLMHMRITLDLDMNIVNAEAVMEHTPFRICHGAQAAMKNLVGLRIGSGWLRQVRERIGMTDSCRHLMELLGPLSTTAYQTMHVALEERANQRPHRERPGIIDQCHALAGDSPVVKVIWPRFYTGNDAGNEEQC